MAGEYALFHLRDKAVCTLELPGLSPGRAFRATRLNWWEMTKTPLALASQQIEVDLTKFGVRLPCNVELRAT